MSYNEAAFDLPAGCRRLPFDGILGRYANGLISSGDNEGRRLTLAQLGGRLNGTVLRAAMIPTQKNGNIGIRIAHD